MKTPFKRFILTGRAAHIFRGVFDSFGCDRSDEQSMTITCAMGTVLTPEQVDCIAARLQERNTFLSAYQYSVTKAYAEGGGQDEYDADGCLIDFAEDEPGCAGIDPTEVDHAEWKKAKETLARVFYDEGVKPTRLPDGRLGYLSEPDGGRRTENLVDSGWLFNAKFIVAMRYEWECPAIQDDPFLEMADWLKATYPQRYDYTCRELINGWDWKGLTCFPLPEDLQNEAERAFEGSLKRRAKYE